MLFQDYGNDTNVSGAGFEAIESSTGDPSLTADTSPDGKEKVWPLYDLKDRQGMIFDEFDIHPEKESERGIVDWDRTYFLTKYYCF